MKKQAIILLAAGMTWSSFMTLPSNTLHAEESSSKVESKQKEEKKRQVSKQEALKIAENFFSVTFEKPQYRYDQKWYRTETPVWHVDFHKETEENEASPRYSVTVDAVNGDIMETNYQLNPEDQQTFSYPPKVTWEKGQTKAHQTVLKYFSDIVKQVEFDETRQPVKPSLSDRVTYTYQYNRIVDGAPYPDNYIRVRVNGNNEVLSFSSRWNPNIDLESQSVEVSPEEAMKKYQNNIPIQMQYDSLNRYYRPSGEDSGKMVLEYGLNNAYPYLDATTGKWLNRKGESASPLSQQEKDPISKKLLEPIRLIKSLMIEQEAKNLSNELANIPENMSLDNVEYNQNEHQPTTWGFTYIDPTQDGEEYEKKRINVRMHATTGEIYSYNLNDRTLYEDLESKEIDINYDEAKNKAIEYVKKFSPSKAHQVYLKTQENEIAEDVEDRKRYTFVFQRLKDDIPVINDSIRVSISAVDGQLIRFYQNWSTEASFPSPENVISKEEAFQHFLDRYNIQLGWRQLQNSDDEATIQKNDGLYRKVYYLHDLNVFDQAVYLDAITGEWHSKADGEVVPLNLEANDIEGLPQENALQLMISYGAIPIDSDGNIHPHKPITRGEMVKMLMLANNPDPVYYQNQADKFSASEASFDDVSANNEYFSYVEEAIRKGFLDKGDKSFKPDELVTRSELAKLLVHALEYDELASNYEMFKQPYQDIQTKEEAGYISIVHHLDIMSSEDKQQFNPNQNIPRAQAAQVFYEYLKARSTLD